MKSINKKAVDRELITLAMRDLQDRICSRLEQIDGVKKFQEDLWEREGGGGGRTRILRKGKVIEKGGVNFSEVNGPVTDFMKKNTEIKADNFLATGVSIVLHPNNPFVPIIHMNVRYFETSDGTYWFGGGIDLTPHYVVPAQAKQFHKELKAVCDKFSIDFYSKFKKWADDYFYIPHREETRGVGGIFFDHLDTQSSGIEKDRILEFCIALGDSFADLYSYQVDCGKNRVFQQNHINWMNLRRGRYVEFNLVNDRGTKFGLVSGGRTESILMSLPATANWEYDFTPEPDSVEILTQKYLKKGIDWLNL